MGLFTSLASAGYSAYQSSKDKTSNSSSSSNSVASNRDKQAENYIAALNEQFQKTTEIELWRYEDRQEDLDLQNKYFQEDFARITSRRNQDYYTWISLQNKEFSQSLDFVQNISKQAVGTFEGLWKTWIIEATEQKIENDIRYKTSYDRAVEDANIWKTRTDARYKLDTSRLGESKDQFITSRDTQKKVMGIQAKWEHTQYYDNLVTGRVLQEDTNARTSSWLFWWWTWIQNIFNY